MAQNYMTHFSGNLKLTEWWPTYLSVTRSLSVVQLHSGGEVRHLPRPELLSRRHIDQILHHCVTWVKQVEEKGKGREWMSIRLYSAVQGIASLKVLVCPVDVNTI